MFQVFIFYKFKLIKNIGSVDILTYTKVTLFKSRLYNSEMITESMSFTDFENLCDMSRELEVFTFHTD